MKQYIYLLLAITTIACNSKTNPKGLIKDFNINICEATYKGKPLPFDEPIEAWENLFGKYDRCLEKVFYIWDSLGVSLLKFPKKINDTNRGNNIELSIYFVNLESPIGQAGKLEHAKGRKSFDFVIKDNEDGGFKYSEEHRVSLKKTIDSDSFSKYNYPFNIYKDTAIIDGAIVAKDMSLKNINNFRLSVKGNGEMGYWKNDNWRNVRGSTNVKSGEFMDFDSDKEGSECAKNNNFIYAPTIRYTEGVLEYIKVAKLIKDEKNGRINWK